MTKFDEGWKEFIKWIVGILGAILLMALKNSYDAQSESNRKLQDKVDKVYDFSTNHEVRMAVIEKQIDEHSQKILDLQLAREREVNQQKLRDEIEKSNKLLNN